MLIETDTGGEREIGANPYEHSSPMGVLDIEVILIDPTPLHLEMPTIVFPDGGHVGGGLTCFDNGYNLIGLGTLEVALHKVIAPAWGIFLNGYTPFLGAVLDPMVILGGDVAQQLVLAVYSFTAGFPKTETYGLALQMRRAAVSVPANIAEGFRRRGKADKARYMNMAEGSLEESRYYLILAKDLGYGDTGSLTPLLEEVSRLLNAYASAILASES